MLEIIKLIDSRIYISLLDIQSIALTVFMRVITYFVSPTFIILFVATSLIFLKKKKYIKYVYLNLIIVFVMNFILKNIIRRERPNVLKLANESSFSFPSAHAMVGIAFYGFIIYLLTKKINNTFFKIFINIIFIVFIFLVGISRIYLGVHYATDILCGFVFGSIYLLFFIKFFENNIIKNKYKNKNVCIEKK